MNARPALPQQPLADRQSIWLREARSRLLRRAGIARRRNILDLGTGWGQVAEELAQRSTAQVVTLDQSAEASTVTSTTSAATVGRIRHVLGSAERLPFADATFDLVFTQLALLWITDAAQAIHEAARVLEADGVLAAIEPDYGGMMEYPPDIETKAVWLAALERAGADPLIGRKLPAHFRRAGFQVETRFLDFLEPPALERFELLTALPLTAEERLRVDQAREASMALGNAAVAHLPFWLMIGERRAESIEHRARKGAIVY